ncbi:Hepatic leukemia factor [Liparis tanakae]|uniref:Hepatic leukemia factor n=1 Tax=Liparis tanakae TaxID=230148 RepID=A0A4Z2E7Z8_9TELE|nr:Hepatic leukemia factor [Liparis tanakae]
MTEGGVKGRGGWVRIVHSAPASARDSPPPIDPESIQVPLVYEPDPQDLALSSVPGQEMFDPRKCKFSAEELKPQPMIKKARKVFIPEDLKVRGCCGGVRGQRSGVRGRGI